MSPRIVTAAELATHSDHKDCWIAVHGIVMNITPFLNEHPGGPDVIVSVSGKDCTHDFEDVGHTDSARRLGDKYIVGRLEGSNMDSPLRVPSNKEVQAIKDAASKSGSVNVLLGLSATAVGLAAMYYAFILSK